MENIIIVTVIEKDRAILSYKDFNTDAFIGENGATEEKKEGDKCTPIGKFELGVSFGIYNKEDIDCSLEYFKINKNQYWVDDINSKYYNELVDISKVKKDWNSAEHLIEYKEQYEYAIEIKSNPKNISNKGSAVFIHCSIKKPTAGCIAIEKSKMKELLKLIDTDTKIQIKKV